MIPSGPALPGLVRPQSAAPSLQRPNELGLVAAPPGLGAAEIAAAAFSGAAGAAPSFVPATATNSGCLSKSFVVVQAPRVINNTANAAKEGLRFHAYFPSLDVLDLKRVHEYPKGIALQLPFVRLALQHRVDPAFPRGAPLFPCRISTTSTQSACQLCP